MESLSVSFLLEKRPVDFHRFHGSSGSTTIPQPSVSRTSNQRQLDPSGHQFDPNHRQLRPNQRQFDPDQYALGLIYVSWANCCHLDLTDTSWTPANVG